MNKKLFTISLVVDPAQLSEDALEWNMEGFFNLLDTLMRDGLAHAEPKLDLKTIKVCMEDAEN